MRDRTVPAVIVLHLKLLAAVTSPRGARYHRISRLAASKTSCRAVAQSLLLKRVIGQSPPEFLSAIGRNARGRVCTGYHFYAGRVDPAEEPPFPGLLCPTSRWENLRDRTPKATEIELRSQQCLSTISPRLNPSFSLRTQRNHYLRVIRPRSHLPEASDRLPSVPPLGAISKLDRRDPVSRLHDRNPRNRGFPRPPDDPEVVASGVQRDILSAGRRTNLAFGRYR